MRRHQAAGVRLSYVSAACFETNTCARRVNRLTAGFVAANGMAGGVQAR